MNIFSPIGVFDSGVGGISVLKTLTTLLPGEDFIYFGDTKNAPYGTKSEAEVLRLSSSVMSFLAARDIKAAVIACNTATAAAAARLREQYTFPIIGMEPALKLAHDSVENNGRILVMATPSTIASEKYDHLRSLYGQNALSVSCPGLMEYVERLETDSPSLHRYLDGIFTDQVRDGLSAVVLGCTHYVFLREVIRRHINADTLILDGNMGTARQLQRRLAERDLLKPDGKDGSVTLLSSGDESSVKIMHDLLQEKLAI